MFVRPYPYTFPYFRSHIPIYDYILLRPCTHYKYLRPSSIFDTLYMLIFMYAHILAIRASILPRRYTINTYLHTSKPIYALLLFIYLYGHKCLIHVYTHTCTPINVSYFSTHTLIYIYMLLRFILMLLSTYLLPYT